MIKRLLNTTDKKRLAENFISLSFLRGVNYLLPLITLPYITRILGPELFGIVSHAEAFIGFFFLFINFGFEFSATREISVNRGNKKKIDEIFSSVIIIKSVLFFVSMLIVLITVFSVNKIIAEKTVYIFTSIMLVRYVIFPSWFFMGIERMRYFAIMNIIAKVIFTVSVFLFIKNPNHYIYVPLINSIGFLVSGIAGFYFAVKKYSIDFKLIPFIRVIKYLKESFHVFLLSVFSMLVNRLNIFLIGFLLSDKDVGYYNAAFKLIFPILFIFNPFFNTLYPYLSRLFAENKKKYLRIFSKTVIVSFVISIFLFLTVFFNTNIIIKIVFGKEFNTSSMLLRIMSVLILVNGAGNCFSILFMLVAGKNSKLSFFFQISFILYIAILLFLHFTIGISLNAYAFMPVMVDFIVKLLSFIEFLKWKKICLDFSSN